MAKAQRAAQAAEATPTENRCKWCNAPFVKTREWQEFDRTACRLAYHRNGPLSKVKMLEAIRKEARRLIREELPALVRVEVERRLNHG